MNRAKFVNGKLAGKIPAGRQEADYKTIFPDSVPFPAEMRDEYGNFCYELVNPGTPEARFERVDVEPTSEQVSAVRKRRTITEKEKAGYDKDDEIALMKKAIEALAKGKPLPNEYVEMENVMQGIKDMVRYERALRRQ